MLKVNIRSFSYGQNEILKDIEFRLAKGEHMAVLGESGCGKSSLLHLVYGLLHLEHGTISWNDNILKGPKFNLVPGESFIKLVAQEFNVMPFTTVAENVAEHLSRRNMDADASRVETLLEVVDLSSFSTVMVKNLSGGQKQRVALAKALANEPELLLLDEPFSHIDTFRKNKLRRKVFSYLKEKNIACITATHDAGEALAFSDTILLLKNGKIDAFGTPRHVYSSVSDTYQAGFFDEVNKLPSSLFNHDNTNKQSILYPHQLEVTAEKTELQVSVLQSYFKGSHYLILANWNGETIFFEHKAEIPKGEQLYLKRRD